MSARSEETEKLKPRDFRAARASTEADQVSHLSGENRAAADHHVVPEQHQIPDEPAAPDTVVEEDVVPKADTTAHGVRMPHEDRWHWRRKVRANPHQHRIYRVVVAAVGLVIIAFGLVTGPLPGPGGIPLVLLGLAILASEFVWAHRLMGLFKVQLHRYQGWTRLQQTGFWVAFLAACGLCGYVFMVVMGVPTWVPSSADQLLERLPGI